jgi:hypothetical protein
MKMNNFDTSSAGDNVELNIYYSTSTASMYYDDFVNGADGVPVTRLDISTGAPLYLVGDSTLSYYKKADLHKMKKAELFDLCNQYDLLDYNVDLNDYKKEDYISDLLNVDIERHYSYLCSEYSFRSIQDHIRHDYFISCGYSQGDAAIVVNVGAEYFNEKVINHTLWDCPIGGLITVNGEDYHIDEMLEDNYNYDKDQLKQSINKLDISDYAKNWLCDNLPDQLDHI